MSSRVSSLASGALFGSALTLSGVAAPRAIIDQLKLTDFHMLLTFLTASACSAATFGIAKHLGFIKVAYKKNSSFGWLGKYDGNIIGGLLLGIGMGVTGSCPGTVLVQAASGIGGKSTVLLSGLLGAMAFIRLEPKYRIIRDNAEDHKHGIPEFTGWSDAATTFAYEAMLLSIILATSLFAPRGTSLAQPLVGGLLIGLAQVFSLMAAKKPLGVSGAYEDAGRYILGWMEGKSKPEIENIVFLAGMLIGARSTMNFAPWSLDIFYPEKNISLAENLLGGFTLIFGARMAGGCTSGHGISGMSTLGVSSFLTVACMFAGGIATTALRGS